MIPVQAVVGLLLRVKLRAEKRNPNRQSNCGVHESHNRAQSQEVLVSGRGATAIVDALSLPRKGIVAPVAGQPARLHDIVRQPETRMPDMPDQLVQARIDGALKEEAATVLAAMGLTVSGALRLLLTKVAHEKALPFAPLVPDAATIEAMGEARRGNLPQFASVEDLFDDLRADD